MRRNMQSNDGSGREFPVVIERFHSGGKTIDLYTHQHTSGMMFYADCKGGMKRILTKLYCEPRTDCENPGVELAMADAGRCDENGNRVNPQSS